MKLEKTATIYGLKVKGHSKYFYVGCTSGRCEKRFTDHLSSVKTGHHLNKHFANKIKKYGAENITLEVLQKTYDINKFDIEKDWIIKLLSEGHPLVNRIHNDIFFCTPMDLSIDERIETTEWIAANKPSVDFGNERTNKIFSDYFDQTVEALRAIGSYLKGIGYEVR